MGQSPKIPHDVTHFRVGDRVQVKREYTERLPYRKTIGLVVAEGIQESPDGDKCFIVSSIRFETGETEYFANWEIDLVERAKLHYPLAKCSNDEGDIS